MLKNPFYDQIKTLYAEGASPEKLKEVLGRGRAKKGMFEGDLIEGELEIGQVAAQIEKIIPAAEIVQEFIADFNSKLRNLNSLG